MSTAVEEQFCDDCQILRLMGRHQDGHCACECHLDEETLGELKRGVGA